MGIPKKCFGEYFNVPYSLFSQYHLSSRDAVLSLLRKLDAPYNLPQIYNTSNQRTTTIIYPLTFLFYISRFICKTCAKCICVFCTHTSHQGHEVMSILEGTASCQQEMEQMVEDCNQRIETINSQLKFIQSWESSYQQTREHILCTASEFLTQVEQ